MYDICVFFVLKLTTLQFYYPINHVLLLLLFTLTLFIIDSRIRILLITLCIIIFL